MGACTRKEKQIYRCRIILEKSIYIGVYLEEMVDVVKTYVQKTTYQLLITKVIAYACPAVRQRLMTPSASGCLSSPYGYKQNK